MYVTEVCFIHSGQLIIDNTWETMSDAIHYMNEYNRSLMFSNKITIASLKELEYVLS
jgi:hypothetical protein